MKRGQWTSPPRVERRLLGVKNLDRVAGAEAADRRTCSVEMPATTARIRRPAVDLDNGEGGLLDVGGGEVELMDSDVVEGEGGIPPLVKMVHRV